MSAIVEYEHSSEESVPHVVSAFAHIYTTWVNSELELHGSRRRTLHSATDLAGSFPVGQWRKDDVVPPLVANGSLNNTMVRCAKEQDVKTRFTLCSISKHVRVT